MSHDHEDGDRGYTSEIDRRGFVQGCGAAVALTAAGTSLGTVTAQEDSETVVERLLADAPDNWGRWGEDDDRGALNLLGSRQAFNGMNAAGRRGADGVERFALQLSMSGEVINPDPDRSEMVFPPEDGENGDGADDAPAWPSTDTGDPAFPPRTPARRDTTTEEVGEPAEGGVTTVDDRFVTDVFLQGTTHMDALGHAWYGGELYNGYDASTTHEPKEFDTPLQGTVGLDALPGDEEACLSPVTETRGLDNANVSAIGDGGAAGRAVLLDVGRHLDASDENDRLPLGYEVTYEDLQSTADAQGTQIEERDVLLVRTGGTERVRDPEAEWHPLNEPGIVYSDELVEWIAEMDVPIVGADNLAVEKVIQQVEVDGEEATVTIPLHAALLRNLGVYLNEILDLRDLAASCAEDGIHEFLYVAAPLNVERATGAPVNPIVLKATQTDGEDGAGAEESEGSDGPGQGGDASGGENATEAGDNETSS